MLDVQDLQLARLTQGINTSQWFAQAPLTSDHFQTHFTIKDIQLIKEMGFRHIRLPVDPDIFFNNKNPESLSSSSLQDFDAALDIILSQNLAVIVDLHSKRDFKKRLESDTTFVNDVAKFWRSLAQHLSQRDPERVFLEVLNEPAAEDPQTWNVIQAQLLSAMRSGAPKHTLIASANLRTSAGWDEIGGLEALTPVADRNVVYNFHFYQPKPFVSQGATWTWKEVLPYLRQVPYPSSPEAVSPILSTIENETARKQLYFYGKQSWNIQKLEGLIQRAAAWRDAHGVNLTCNEFGVYRVVAPPNDRNTWIRDVRSLLEKYHIGWAMWDYAGGFGVVQNVNGEARPDIGTLKALFESN